MKYAKQIRRSARIRIAGDENKSADIVRFVLLSDTHSQHWTVQVPEGDFLIHAGDLTLFNRTRDTVRDFNQFLLKLPHRGKVVIPGNHDFKFGDSRWRRLISAATLLFNEGVELEGIRV